MENLIPIGSIITLKDYRVRLMVTGYSLEREQPPKYYVVQYPQGLGGPLGQLIIDSDMIKGMISVGYQEWIYRKEIYDYNSEREAAKANAEKPV